MASKSGRRCFSSAARSIRSGNSSSFPLANAAAFVASVPLLIWAHDSLYSLCRVTDSSMEPALKTGDILLVRRSDIALLHSRKPQSKSESVAPSIFDRRHDAAADDEKSKRQLEMTRLIQYEDSHCNPDSGGSFILQRPPIVLTGDIAVYKSPHHASTWPPYGPWLSGSASPWITRRIAGLGGQLILAPPQGNVEKTFLGRTERQFFGKRSIPPYTIWVEGDNDAIENDENREEQEPYEFVCKKLLVGVAEYIVWPPTRMRKIERPKASSNAHDEDDPFGPMPRSYWP